MNETTNENLQDAEKAKVVEINSAYAGTTETPTLEIHDGNQHELKDEFTPKLIGTKIITIKTDIYDNDQQNINITTPDGSSMSENLGMLKIAEHILLKNKF